MEHAEAKNLLALRVLGRLEREPAREVDSHLASGCEECKRELKALHEAAARLSNAASWSEVAKPAGWESFRDEWGRKIVILRGGLFLVAAVVAAIVAFAVNRFFPPVPARSAAAGRAAADTAAIRGQMDTMSQQIDWAGNKIAALDGRLAANTDLMIAGLSPDSRVARIAGSPAAPKSMGIVAISRAQGAAILEVTGLPPTPGDKVYEAWWIGAKQGPLRAGLFEPAGEGPTIVSLDLPAADGEPLSCTITLEQRGGSDKPGGALYATADFPRR